MRFDAPDDDSAATEINMTPMIDCVFLLLIFFLVATVLKKVDREVELELPQVAHAVEKKTKEEKPVVLSIDRKGVFYYNGSAVGLELLHTHLRELAAKDKKQNIRIDGDKDSAFQDLAHILDLCSFEGLKNVSIHTNPQRP